ASLGTLGDAYSVIVVVGSLSIMSVSSNNEELRAALNRRLAKRAHRAPNRPTTAPPSAFDKKPPVPANDTVNDRPRRDVASASGGERELLCSRRCVCASALDFRTSYPLSRETCFRK
ncbi:hypothetical protein FOZ62_008193, partial [Perkinsus olseni]